MSNNCKHTFSVQNSKFIWRVIKAKYKCNAIRQTLSATLKIDFLWPFVQTVHRYFLAAYEQLYPQFPFPGQPTSITGCQTCLTQEPHMLDFRC